MIGKYYEFNNCAINKKTDDYEIFLTKVDWKNIESSDTVEHLEGYHGVKTTPTFARERKINIEGFFESSSLEGKGKAMNYLESIFALAEENETPLNSSFSVIDELNRRWDIKCKIKKPLEYELEDDDYEVSSSRKFKISFIAPDPRLLKYPINKISGKEGIFGGIKLPLKSSFQMNGIYNIINIDTISNIKSPLKIEIIVKQNKKINPPLTIKNLTTNEFITLNISAVYGDKIIVDSEKKVCLKNDIDISNKRGKGSVFPYIKGKNKFMIQDVDGGLQQNDFKVNFYYYDTLL